MISISQVFEILWFNFNFSEFSFYDLLLFPFFSFHISRRFRRGWSAGIDILLIITSFIAKHPCKHNFSLPTLSGETPI